MTPFVLVDEMGFCVRPQGAERENVGCEELRMDPNMACSEAHPAPGEEVMAMDDVDVPVGSVSVTKAPNLEERMSAK